MNKIAIWGAGYLGAALIMNPHFQRNNTIVALIDSNPLLHGVTRNQIEVSPPSILHSVDFNYVVIAAENYEAEITEQLIHMGVPLNKVLRSSVIGFSKKDRTVFRNRIMTESLSNFSLGQIEELTVRGDYASDYIRYASFWLIVEEIKKRRLSGSVAELGVWRGRFASLINKAFPDKKLYLFDTFEGFDERDLKFDLKNSFLAGHGSSNCFFDLIKDTSITEVMSRMPFPDQCVIKKGYFPDSLEGLDDTFCFVSLDVDLYLPMKAGLEYFYPRMVRGGVIFVHDYSSDETLGGVKAAVTEFCEANHIMLVPIPDEGGTAIIIR